MIPAMQETAPVPVQPASSPAQPAGERDGAPEGGLGLLDVLLLLSGHLRLLVLLPLAAGCVMLGATYLMAPIYTASVQLMAPQQSSTTAAALLGSLGGAAGALGGSLGGLKNPADQWVGLLQSRTIADALVQRFKLQELYESPYRFQARDKLAQRSRISAGKDGLIDIEVDDENPERAAGLAAAYAEELQKLSNSLAVTEAAQRRVFFQKRLEETKGALVKAEVALKEGGISANVLKTSPEAAVGQLAQAQAAVAAQEVRVAVMRGSMTSGNPELQSAQRELESLREQLRRAEQAQPGQGSGPAAQYVARYREFKYQETLFELFARQYELARADEAKDGALIQVVDAVEVPEYKSRPRRGQLAVLVSLGTLVLCISYVLTRQALRLAHQNPATSAKLALLFRRRGLAR